MMTATEHRPAALYLGLALTALVALAPLIDTATAGSIAEHVRAAYVRLERNAIVAWTAITNALGIPLWLWTIRLVGKGRRRARTVAAWAFAAGTGLALLNLSFGSEQYETVLPPFFGLIGLLPALACLVALVAVWKRSAEPKETR